MEDVSPRPALGRGVWPAIALALAVPFLAGASHEHQTANFRVEAPTPEIARKVGEHAESCRKSIAVAWLGRELPTWRVRCPIKVRVTAGEAGGLTTFGFAGGRVTDQVITVEGRVDRILASALPHEVTHTVFAAYFGGPMPRWADEGASLLSEDDREIRRHDQIVLDLLGRRGDMALGSLFEVEEYPKDLMGFYGQGYSGLGGFPRRDGRPSPLPPVRPRGVDRPLGRRRQGPLRPRQLQGAGSGLGGVWHKVVMETKPAAGPAVVLRAQSASE